MSSQVLARKWRPQNFKSLVGQQHVVRALINALENQRLHHAYLFTGTRGVGKTTIARILAKCLNCETGITSEPCGVCQSCQDIADGCFVDLIEVDAASRTKVEDTRDLLDNVQYAPTRGRFKVYLIDEVHMLSGHSFNALLKTLEEPPEHVKFLFATTDPKKLPITVLSRCLQFNLKRISNQSIAKHLEHVLSEEKMPNEEAALNQLSHAADGSMRDALSLLDQAIAYSGNEITLDHVDAMLGTVAQEPLIDLLLAVDHNDGEQVLSVIEQMADVTVDFQSAADALITLLHQVAVKQAVPNSVSESSSVDSLAEKLSAEDIQLYYQIALNGRRDLSLSPHPRAGFEMIVLRMLAFRPLDEDQSIHEAGDNVDNSESKKKTIANHSADSNKTENKLEATQEHSQESKGSNVVPLVADVAAKALPTSNDNIVTAEFQQNNTPASAVPEFVQTAQRSEVSAPDWRVDLEQSPLSPPAQESLADKPETDEFLAKPVEEKSIETVNLSELNETSWIDHVEKFPLVGQAMQVMKHSVFESQNNGQFSLSINRNLEQLLTPNIQADINQGLSQYVGEDVTVSFEKKRSAEVDLPEKTVAAKQEKFDKDKQLAAEQSIENDEFIQTLKSEFGAQMIPNSIKPID